MMYNYILFDELTRDQFPTEDVRQIFDICGALRTIKIIDVFGGRTVHFGRHGKLTIDVRQMPSVIGEAYTRAINHWFAGEAINIPSRHCLLSICLRYMPLSKEIRDWLVHEFCTNYSTVYRLLRQTHRI